MQHRLTKPEKASVCSRYQKGDATTVLAVEFKVSVTAICGILHRRGIPCRSPSLARKTCTLKDEVFDTITPESAYWAGFLFADGCISHRAGSPAVTLRLADKDATHVELFRKFMGSSHKVINVQKGTQISFRSTNVVTKLESLGMRGKLLSVADPELANHVDFWRGVVDGDGWLGPPKGTRHTPRFELCGGFPLMTQFANFVRSLYPSATASVRPMKSIFRVGLNGKIAYQLISKLYSNPGVCLARKRNASLNILALGLQGVGNQPVEAAWPKGHAE